ncbi:tripartite tricarboxylate transporter substrate binding protein [Xanthobacter sp. KR7-225]|uniref:Bug family tripartite tricarboxylate transporter substrate binding protein n=1 Tax=Xanthobacter sp. KR7-225 TaxID=3156613 RepID=UPI0032B410D7
MKTLAVAVMSLAVLASPGAMAQEKWPAKTIKLIVPYAPGGYTDLTGRITARFLEKELGQTVVVENKPGAGGIVGTDLVAKSAPDGYSFCVCSVGAVSVAPVAQTTQYDPLKDLAPISIVSTIPQTVIVNPKLPIKTIPELVAYAKANPGKLTYGSSGAGGLMHFSVQLFDARTGTKMVHVPFKGGAPATAAVVAGEVDLSFTNMTDALPQMEAGTVRGIAVTSGKRSPFAPDLPTVEETGVKDFSVESWNGIIAPPGTPKPVIERMSAALKKMSEDPEVKAAFAKIGASPVFTTPEEYQAAIAKEVAQWTGLLKEIKATKN